MILINRAIIEVGFRHKVDKRNLKIIFLFSFLSRYSPLIMMFVITQREFWINDCPDIDALARILGSGLTL